MEMETLCKLYLELANVVPSTCVSSRELNNASLRKAAEQVCWFDWSGNDADAIAAIDHLRSTLG